MQAVFSKVKQGLDLIDLQQPLEERYFWILTDLGMFIVRRLRTSGSVHCLTI